MCRELIYLMFVILVLGLSAGQAQEVVWDRAAYWDAQYPSAWAGGDLSIRDALQAAGYDILSATELKTWMNGHIADKKLSVVVFCQDSAPDTVAESMSANCTLRKYLDAGGKIVWYSDIPFYYQGHADNSNTTWGDAGGSGVLGFSAASAPRDTYNTVTFTEAGIAWGLTEPWESQRPTSSTATANFTVLATDNAGNAAAWAKHYLPGDNYRGFVRIFDRTGVPASADDVIRVAEYLATKAASPTPPDGAIHPDTWVTLGWSPGAFAVSHDVYLGESFDDVYAGTAETFRGNQTATYFTIGFPGFPYPDGLVPGTTYYWRVDEIDPVNSYKGDVWSFTIPPKTAFRPDPADGAEFVDPNTVLSWRSGFGAILHTVYFGDDYDDVNNAAGGIPQGLTTYKPGTLKLEKLYYWRVDEFHGFATYKGDVWGFTTPGAAGSLRPVNGARGVQMNVTLNWTPATTATSHDVYFGTDKEAVRSATTASPEFKGNKAIGSESYDPGKLAWHSDYYWRVDAVYNAGPVKGLLWNFKTADFLLVDDFESYNDIDPPDPASNRIFDKWIDGFGTTNNGALVGNDLPPYAEQTVVHGGAQSMPYAYDNNLKTSEATLTLVYPRDWTEEGVGKLSLWLRGASANSAERMYVALNGTAVVYNDDPAATQTSGWTQWVVDLQAFADQGVNLANVNTITIGIGTKNGPAAGDSGQMYFDDIRLIR